MKRVGLLIGLVTVVAVSYLCVMTKNHTESVRTMPAATSTKPRSVTTAYLFPYKSGFRYPDIPSELQISKGSGLPQHLLRVAKNRAEIVEWAENNDIPFVQNMGNSAFLLSCDIGSGAYVWVVYIYVRNGDHWQLMYVGNGGLKHLDNWEHAYFDASGNRVHFAKADGHILSTVSIERELKLLKASTNTK